MRLVSSALNFIDMCNLYSSSSMMTDQIGSGAGVHDFVSRLGRRGVAHQAVSDCLSPQGKAVISQRDFILSPILQVHAARYVALQL